MTENNTPETNAEPTQTTPQTPPTTNNTTTNTADTTKSDYTDPTATHQQNSSDTDNQQPAEGYEAIPVTPTHNTPVDTPSTSETTPPEYASNHTVQNTAQPSQPTQPEYTTPPQPAATILEPTPTHTTTSAPATAMQQPQPATPPYPAPPTPTHHYAASPTQPGVNQNTASLNGTAIAAIILAIIFPIVGAILGHISLSQIKKRAQQGRPLALTATIIGWVLTVIWTIVIIISIIGITLAVQNASTSTTPSNTTREYTHTETPEIQIPTPQKPEIPHVDTEQPNPESEFCQHLIQEAQQLQAVQLTPENMLALTETLAKHESPHKNLYERTHAIMKKIVADNQYEGTPNEQNTVKEFQKTIPSDVASCLQN